MSSAATTVPENKDAPCNICGRGWPYHHNACAYKQTAIERDRYREALEAIESMTGSAGAGQIPTMPVARRARKALNG